MPCWVLCEVVWEWKTHLHCCQGHRGSFWYDRSRPRDASLVLLFLRHNQCSFIMATTRDHWAKMDDKLYTLHFFNLFSLAIMNWVTSWSMRLVSEWILQGWLEYGNWYWTCWNPRARLENGWKWWYMDKKGRMRWPTVVSLEVIDGETLSVAVRRSWRVIMTIVMSEGVAEQIKLGCSREDIMVGTQRANIFTSKIRVPWV